MVLLWFSGKRAAKRSLESFLQVPACQMAERSALFKELPMFMSATSVWKSVQHSMVACPVGDPRFSGSTRAAHGPSLARGAIPHLNPGDQACIQVHHKRRLHTIGALSP